jgi:hypothetical protein
MCEKSIPRPVLSDRLALLIWAATPDRPELVVAPLVHALAALALDAEVEIHFAGPAVRWLVCGVAENTWPTPEREKCVAAFLNEVAANGGQYFACGMAQAVWVGATERLRADAGAAGATAFVARALDPAWTTLVY